METVKRISDNKLPPDHDLRVFKGKVASANRQQRPALTEWFVRELTNFAGKDPATGNPMLRIVFGQDRDAMEFREGKWRFRYLLGFLKCEFEDALRGREIEIGGVKTYVQTPLVGRRKEKEPIGLPYYFVEPFIPTKWMCSEEYWEENLRWEKVNPATGDGNKDLSAIQRALKTGQVENVVAFAEKSKYRMDILGPYPRNGYYQAGWRLLNEDGSPAAPNQQALDEIKVRYTTWLEERKLTAEQIIAREQEAERVQAEYDAEQFKKDLVAAIRDIKMQVLGHKVSFPGARPGTGMDAR